VERRIKLTTLELQIIAEILEEAHDDGEALAIDRDFTETESATEQREHKAYVAHVGELAAEFRGRFEADEADDDDNDD